jgi:hypothetical protein
MSVLRTLLQKQGAMAALSLRKGTRASPVKNHDAMAAHFLQGKSAYPRLKSRYVSSSSL